MCAVNGRLPERILIIDDDVDLLMLLERSLDKRGYAVESAVSLSEAEEILLYFDPQLVLLDINVNGEDGRTLCWQLKQREPSVKVALISGYDISPARAALFGADDLVAKPFPLDLLMYRVESLLGSSSMKAGLG